MLRFFRICEILAAIVLPRTLKGIHSNPSMYRPTLLYFMQGVLPQYQCPLQLLIRLCDHGALNNIINLNGFFTKLHFRRVGPHSSFNLSLLAYVILTLSSSSVQLPGVTASKSSNPSGLCGNISSSFSRVWRQSSARLSLTDICRLSFFRSARWRCNVATKQTRRIRQLRTHFEWQMNSIPYVNRFCVAAWMQI